MNTLKQASYWETHYRPVCEFMSDPRCLDYLDIAIAYSKGILRTNPYYMTEGGGYMFKSDKICEETAVYTIPSTEILVTKEFIDEHKIKEFTYIDSFRGICSISWEVLLVTLNPTEKELRNLMHLDYKHKDTNFFVYHKKQARGVTNYKRIVTEDLYVNKTTQKVVKVDSFTLKKLNLIERCENSLKFINIYFELLENCLRYDDYEFNGDGRRRDLRDLAYFLINFLGRDKLFSDIIDHTDYKYYLSLTTKQRHLFAHEFFKNSLNQILEKYPIEPYLDLKIKYEDLIVRIQNLN